MTQEETETARECHILPCTIDYTGVLPTDGQGLMYFQPQPLSADEDNAVYAAQFRGRGLLAAKPVSINGQVMHAVDSNALQTVSVFHKVSEWQHVHQSTSIASSSSQLSKAMNWYEIASALRAPVNIMDE